jgi:predicted RNA-binding protein
MKLCDCFIGQLVKVTATMDEGHIGVIIDFTSNNVEEVVPVVKWVTKDDFNIFPIHPANITNKGF